MFKPRGAWFCQAVSLTASITACLSLGLSKEHNLTGCSASQRYWYSIRVLLFLWKSGFSQKVIRNFSAPLIYFHFFRQLLFLFGNYIQKYAFGVQPQYSVLYLVCHPVLSLAFSESKCMDCCLNSVTLQSRSNIWLHCLVHTVIFWHQMTNLAVLYYI